MKGGAPPNETDLFRRAKAEGKSEDELLAKAAAATPTKLGLPTTWRNREGSVNIPGPSAKIVAPTKRELGIFSDATKRVCGECKFFNIEKGREEIIRQRFAERLVNDEQWKMHHLGAPPDSIGLCDQSGGEMATTVVSLACDQFRPRRGARGG